MKQVMRCIWIFSTCWVDKYAMDSFNPKDVLWEKKMKKTRLTESFNLEGVFFLSIGAQFFTDNFAQFEFFVKLMVMVELCRVLIWFLPIMFFGCFGHKNTLKADFRNLVHEIVRAKRDESTQENWDKTSTPQTSKKSSGTMAQVCNECELLMGRQRRNVNRN